MLRKPVGRDGGDEARIRNDSQEGKKLIRYHQQAKLECNATPAKERTRRPAVR